MRLFFTILSSFCLLWSELLPIKLLVVFIKKDEKSLKRLAVSLTKLAPKLGPAFVKLGQFFSTREDILPKILCQELSSLQDKAPTIAFEKIAKIVKQEIGEVLQLEREPLAAASIAQVHRATLLGEEVVVKVLRPGIRKAFARNLELLLFIAKIINKIIKPANRLRLLEVIDLLIETSNIELDLQFEAAAADKLRYNSRARLGVVIPKIFWDFSSKDVLVMEWIDGKKLNFLTPELKKTLAKKLAITFFEQVYLDGFFHADLHFGNLLLDKAGNLVFLDFGLHSFLPDKDRFYLAEMIYAFLHKDYDKVSELHFKLGYLDNYSLSRKNRFALACRTIAEPIFGKNTSEIALSQLLRRLFRITADFQMQTQPQILLLQKNLLSLEGLVKILDPEINLWDLLKPWFKSWAKENLSYVALTKRKLNSLLTKIDEKLDF
jgi:ubiquinone biosynthesis protein